MLQMTICHYKYAVLCGNYLNIYITILSTHYLTVDLPTIVCSPAYFQKRIRENGVFYMIYITLFRSTWNCSLLPRSKFNDFYQFRNKFVRLCRVATTSHAAATIRLIFFKLNI